MGLAALGSLLPEAPFPSALIVLFLTVTLLSLCTHCLRRASNRLRNTEKSDLPFQTMPDEKVESRETPSISSVTMDEIVIQPPKMNGVSQANEDFLPWRSHTAILDLQDVTQNGVPVVKNSNSEDKSTDITTGDLSVQSIPVDKAAKTQQALELVVPPGRETVLALQSGSAPLVPSQSDFPNAISQPDHVGISKSQNQHIYEKLAEDKELCSVPRHSMEELEDPAYNTIEELEASDSHNTGQKSESQHKDSAHELALPVPVGGATLALGDPPNVVYARVSRKNKSTMVPSQSLPLPPPDFWDDREETLSPPLPKRNFTQEDYESIKDTGN